MSEQPLRWGILGTANIARKNWQAIRNSGNSTLAAVASRDLARGRRFIDECQASAPFPLPPRALGSYEELIDALDVDALYIPLPTGLRKDWVIRAAEAGNHVLCEKPCAASAADLREMLTACRHNGVQFMDGVMFMHSARLGALRAVLDDGASVGAIRRIESAFTFPAPENFFTTNIRANGALEPAGCLGDLGWYCIRLALWAMKWQLPQAVSGRMHSPSGSNTTAAVPTEFSGELLFSGGVSAGFHCSFLTANQQWAHLSGGLGCVRLADFVLPFHGSEVAFEVDRTEFQTNGCDFNMAPRLRRVTVPEFSNSHPTAQETNMFRNFTVQVRSGRLNEEWPAMALSTQQVMEACLKSARNEGALVAID